MKSGLLHILICLTMFIGFVSCSNDEPEVIPRNTLAKIYAEMLVTDQWIVTTPNMRHIADTSMVYEPILNKFGYDSDDYRKSIDFYMDDPERFSRIFRTSVQILDEQLAELQKEKDRLDAIAKLPVVKFEFKASELHKYFDGEAYIHYFDSLDVRIDSNLRQYQLSSVERSDTLFDGIRIIHRDSLAARDSVTVVVKPDSVSRQKETSLPLMKNKRIGTETILAPGKMIKDPSKKTNIKTAPQQNTR